MTSDNLKRVALIERLRTSAHNMEVIGERMPINAVERAAIKCLRGAIDDAAAALSAIPAPSPMGEKRARELLAIEYERAIVDGFPGRGERYHAANVRVIGKRDYADWKDHAAVRAIQAAVAEADEWRRVVTDALVVSHIYRKEHDSDPRLALNELLCWERVIALDPKVSEDAAKLVAEETERCASFADQWSQPEAKYLSAMQGLTDAEHSIAQQTAEGIATAIRKGVA